jgi:hypothetical protein
LALLIVVSLLVELFHSLQPAGSSRRTLVNALTGEVKSAQIHL